MVPMPQGGTGGYANLLVLGAWGVRFIFEFICALQFCLCLPTC